jgi:hypothetical protein
METVKELNPDKFKELQFYLSSDLTITTFSERKSDVNEGGVVRKNGGESHTITIPRTSKGEYVEYKPGSKKNEDSFLIKLQEMELIFLRKTQINRFVLHFMVNKDGGVTNVTAKMPYPYLCHFEYTEGEDFPPSPAELLQSRQSQVPSRSSTVDRIPVSVMGRGTLNKDVIVSYIRNKGSVMPSQQIETLAGYYINEAWNEGINHDIAIAQMCFATKFLNDRQLLESGNYGGLNTEMGISVRGGSRHINAVEGVRAHIQHLKGYASTEPPRSDLVDKRYHFLVTSGIRGTVTTLERLFAVWMPHNAQGYGNEIKKILGELYQSQSSGRSI